MSSAPLAPSTQSLSPEPRKFADKERTAKGEQRAFVDLERLDTLWFNTGTLCNIECANCYIESSPSNDRLAYLTVGDVVPFLDEIQDLNLGTREIGFTGGEPFLNPSMLELTETCLERGFHVLILTNAMEPMRRPRVRQGLSELNSRFPSLLKIRVSLDHPEAEKHDSERGVGGYESTLAGLRWLRDEGFTIDIAGRTRWSESEDEAREGFRQLFERECIPVDSTDPGRLVLFPEMDERVEVPEITTGCWNILGKTPQDVMCSSSRMVVKRKGEKRATVLACTLLPYDHRFELGNSLEYAGTRVWLNHPHCSKFCILGGGKCSK